MMSQSEEIVPPPAFVSPNVAVVSLLSVIAALDEPETVNMVTVCVVPFANTRECAAVPVSFRSAKVLLPVIVLVAVLAPRANHTLWNAVAPSPTKLIAVLLVSVTLIVAVFAVKVGKVYWNFHTAPVPVKVHVPEPIVRVYP
jgi:hypothetical protein